MKEESEEKKRSMAISVWINQETLDEIDQAAKWASLSRSKLIQNIIESGLSDLKVMRAIGIVRLALISLELRKKWSKAIKESSDKDNISGKRITDRGVNVSLWMDSKIIFGIEDLAGKLNISRSELIENFIDMGILTIRDIRTKPFDTIALFLRDLHDRWKRSYMEAEKSHRKGTLKLEEINKE
jgi:hypothetical protein